MIMHIREFKPEDWNKVSSIYQQGLETRNATFEVAVPDYETWIKKFRSQLLWVAVVDNQVLGWAGLQPVSPRKVYEGVVEVSIYIDTNHTGKGIGKVLMHHLIPKSEEAEIWTL